jgi:bile acid:Na+ symporter, BASS family
MNELDAVRLNFSPQSLVLLNAVLGLVVFGVSLDLKVADFRSAFATPKALLIGLFCHHLVFPAFTRALVWLLQPLPSIALGMILVSSCPAGHISNFLTQHARGNTALSISISATSTLAAIFMTPFNVAFWGSLYPPSHALLRQVALNPWEMLLAVFLLLGLPLAAGLAASHRYPDIARRAQKPMKVFSLVVFAVYVIGALAANFAIFLHYVGFVVGVVFVHNALALVTGYLLAMGAGLPERDRRAVSIETGIQNSGLGLILIFNFFDGLGGMAIVAAWWGIWHIVAGLTVATVWSLRPPPAPAPAPVPA